MAPPPGPEEVDHADRALQPRPAEHVDGGAGAAQREGDPPAGPLARGSVEQRGDALRPRGEDVEDATRPAALGGGEEG